MLTSYPKKETGTLTASPFKNFSLKNLCYITLSIYDQKEQVKSSFNEKLQKTFLHY